MPVLKCFFKVIVKHINIISIYIGVFICLCIGFSSQAKDMSENLFSPQSQDFSVIDNDDSALSRAVKQKLEENNNLIEFEAISPEVIRDALYNQEISYAVFIPEGYEEQFSSDCPLELETAKSQSFSGFYLDSQIEGFLSIYRLYRAAGIPEEEATRRALEASDIKGEVDMLNTGESEEMPGIYYYYIYLTYALMCVMMLGLAPVLQTFLKGNAKTRLLCSPLSAVKVNLNLALGSAIFAAVTFIALWIYGVCAYGSQMFTYSSYLCTINALCFMPVCIGLSYFAAYAANNAGALNAIGNSVSLALCFLGGVYVPLEIMGDDILNVARFTPTYWYVMSAQSAWRYDALTQTQLNDIYSFMGLELLFGAAFFAVALAVAAKKRA